MTELSVLLFGIGLGFRHAADADHVVVVTTLVQRERGAWRAARTAALWGAGHTVTFLTLGLLIVLAELRVPPCFERGVEVSVGLMLIGLGVWHLVKGREQGTAASSRAFGTYVRPVIIGLVHGLAGSAAVALIAVSTITPRALAVAHLGLVALGTVLGMISLTVILSRSIDWTMRGRGQLRLGITWFAALLSIGLGVLILKEGLFGSNGH